MSERRMSEANLAGLLRKMGHDMRVPLNTLISTSDMLAQGIYGDLNPKQEKAVNRLQRNSYRLLAILDDFITYVKAKNGELESHPEPFDPRILVDKSATSVCNFAEEKHLKLNQKIGEAVPEMLVGDEKLISRILLALLWNAVAFTSSGEISVSSDWTATGGWVVAVQDTGPGISEDDLPHIFEPFWRGVERPQVPVACAGLGLPLSRALTEVMKGQLELNETGPSGSKFTFCLPLPVASDISRPAG